MKTDRIKIKQDIFHATRILGQRVFCHNRDKSKKLFVMALNKIYTFLKLGSNYRLGKYKKSRHSNS